MIGYVLIMSYTCFIAYFTIIKTFEINYYKNSAGGDLDLDSKAEYNPEVESELNEDKDYIEELDNNNLITINPDHNYKEELPLILNYLINLQFIIFTATKTLY